MEIIYKYVEIKSYESGNVEKRYDVSNKHHSQIDRFERGLNINLNHDKYYTFQYDGEVKKEEI